MLINCVCPESGSGRRWNIKIKRMTTIQRYSVFQNIKVKQYVSFSMYVGVVRILRNSEPVLVLLIMIIW